METALRICPLCEATCGLTLTIDDGRLTAARGDRDDVFSAGFVCPKGATLPALDNDPDRLRRPMVREGSRWREVDWPEAFAAVDAGLNGVIDRHGREAVAAYNGNPNVHTLAGQLYQGLLARALGSKHVYTASTVDQMPKHVSCGLMFGDPFTIPVPDLDRTDHLLMLGANPLESNGSLCTAPDFPGRLKALRARGGRLVVVDPRRTRTADRADEHVAVRPGTDAYLLFAMVDTLFSEGLADPGALAEHTDGLEEVCTLAKDFPAETVADVCGIGADRIRALARDLAQAPTAAVYGRMGTTTAEFGTLTSWLVDVLNLITGNLDRPGGAMFAQGAHRPAGRGRSRPFVLGRHRSRVRGLAEAKGELPSVTLVDEIATPGPGQVRALLTVAGNPVLSVPGGDRLARELSGLEFMVSVDPYLNETTRHAHVILPPAPPSRTPHFDISFGNLSVRNTVRYSRPVLPLGEGEAEEALILRKLVQIASGRGHEADPEAVDEAEISRVLTRAVADPGSPVHGRDPEELAAALYPGTGPERRVDLMLRLGAYGEGFGADPDGLTLQSLLDAPHGIDLGPLRPRLPELLSTATGRVQVCPQPLADDTARLREALPERRDSLVLVGRRHLRSNNSWGHNVPRLTGGTNTCTLHVHPGDADRLGLADGGNATLRTDYGEVTAPVECTDTVMAGVVSLPHGWGHTDPETRLSAAASNPGVNVNAVIDPSQVDPLSGNAVLNGVPVEVLPSH
ncbi:molybdopterin-dependent oxidoreductase [Nocardiopsis sp. LOL_012]|uniref:molybdopterin-dependent oxidoreductase n=1 Tax=Nocardiopsis sp. LOL_012 TaxID=3345409 RepID=UPI003A8566AE